MNVPEKFREAPPIRDGEFNKIASVQREEDDPNYDRTVCRIRSAMLNVHEARALRDWLNEVIP